MQLDVRNDQVLARIEAQLGRGPVGKIFAGDGDVIGSGIELLELKESVVVRQQLAGIFEAAALEDDGGAGKGVAAHIGYSAGDMSCPRLRRVGVLCRQRRGYRYGRQNQQPDSLGSHSNSLQCTSVGYSVILPNHLRSPNFRKFNTQVGIRFLTS